MAPTRVIRTATVDTITEVNMEHTEVITGHMEVITEARTQSGHMQTATTQLR